MKVVLLLAIMIVLPIGQRAVGSLWGIDLLVTVGRLKIGFSTIIVSTTRVLEIVGGRSDLCCNSRVFECEF